MLTDRHLPVCLHTPVPLLSSISWRAAVHGVEKNRTQLPTEQQQFPRVGDTTLIIQTCELRPIVVKQLAGGHTHSLEWRHTRTQAAWPHSPRRLAAWPRGTAGRACVVVSAGTSLATDVVLPAFSLWSQVLVLVVKECMQNIHCQSFRCKSKNDSFCLPRLFLSS